MVPRQSLDPEDSQEENQKLLNDTLQVWFVMLCMQFTF